MFRTVPLSFIRRFLLYTQQWCMSYRFADSLRVGSGSWSCSQAVGKPVWHTPLLCVQWKTRDDGQRNCLKDGEFYSKNKFEKLVHLVGFITRIQITLSSVRLHLILSEVDCFCTLQNGLSFNYFMYCMLPKCVFTTMKETFKPFLLLEIILYLLLHEFLESHWCNKLKWIPHPRSQHPCQFHYSLSITNTNILHYSTF